MKKIYITGNKGFVGQNLQKYLNGEFEIIGLNRENTQNYQNFGFDQGSTIIHLAGLAHDLSNVVEPSAYYEINAELTKTIYDKFLVSKVEKFVFFSSVKAAADSVENELTENHTPNPLTHYGKSKLLAENYILENIPLDKKVYIVRPCMIHGEGNKGNLNLLFQFVKKGFPWPLGAFDNKRSFLGIDNLCFIIKEFIIRNEIRSGVYNIADAESVSTTEIIQLIAAERKIKIKILNISKNLVFFLATIGDILKLKLNTENVKKLTDNYEVSNSKLLHTLNKRLPYSSKEGLIKTIRNLNDTVL